MDPQDHLGALLDGTRCTVCDRPVPGDRVRLLAHRDDLVFVQLDCAGCRSTTLGFIVASDRSPDTAGVPDAAPIGGDDVLDMHELLAGWHGDLASLVGRPGRGAPGPGRDARP